MPLGLDFEQLDADDQRTLEVLASPLGYASALGAIGLVCGYGGPLLLSEEASQGPLLLFVTGPLGAFAGALLGLVLGRAGLVARLALLPVSGALYGGAVLAICAAA